MFSDKKSVQLFIQKCLIDATPADSITYNITKRPCVQVQFRGQSMGIRCKKYNNSLKTIQFPFLFEIKALK